MVSTRVTPQNLLILPASPMHPDFVLSPLSSLEQTFLDLFKQKVVRDKAPRPSQNTKHNTLIQTKPVLMDVRDVEGGL